MPKIKNTSTSTRQNFKNHKSEGQENGVSIYSRSINLLDDDPLEEIFALNLGDFLTEHLINPELASKVSKKAKDNQDGPVLEGFLLRTPWVDANDGTASFDIETAAERDKRLEQEKIAAFKARQAELAKFDDPRFIGLLRGKEALAALNDALNNIENSKEAL